MKTQLTITISKGKEWPWFQKYKTFGGYMSANMGVLGIHIRLDYGFKKQ